MKISKLFVVTLAFFASVFLFKPLPQQEAYAFSPNLSSEDFVQKENFSKENCLIKEVKPWDTVVNFLYDGGGVTYRLSDNLEGMTQKELEDRLVFASSRVKASWVKKCVEEGFGQAQCLCYVFPNLKQTLDKISEVIFVPPQDATIKFLPSSKEKFSYTSDKKGRAINEKNTCKNLFEALNHGDNSIDCQVVVEEILPATSLSVALNATTKRGEFETTFNTAFKSRQNNVALALSFFNGFVLKKGETASFNSVVGERTKQRGFLDAKVLLNGNYVEGVGGGVCQASTTLFNALILADVKVKAVCQHSVKSSYVLPSFDAMVTDNGADLVFYNNTDSELYFATSCRDGKARVEIFGLPNEYQIERRSVVTQKIAFDTIFLVDEKQEYSDKVTYRDESFVLKAGVEGVESQGWVDYKKDGKIVFSKRIRTNYYKPIDMVVVRGAKERSEGE